VTHSRSDIGSHTSARHLALGIVAVFAVLGSSIGSLAALVTTDRYIVTVDDVVTEDQYVTAVSAIVEGTIEGDLTVFAGSVTIRGEVTGNVNVASSGTVVIEDTGIVGGSLNGATFKVSIKGAVTNDVFVTSGSVVVEQSGEIGRDLMTFGVSTVIDGDVKRDVRGRTAWMNIDGSVGGDVDVATQKLDVGATATIDGDVVYRSALDAGISDEASIGGTVTRLPAQSNFVYGIILMLANVIGFLGFLVAGLVALWLFRSTASHATGAMLRRPIRSFLVGLATIVAVPFVVVLLAATLVGIPLAVIVLLFAGVGFIIGPVPAVTALGNRLLFRRGGLFGAFLLGAVLWRLGIWLIPLVGGALYLIALVWGVGAWVLGTMSARRADPFPVELLPAGLVADGEIPADWVPPLAPGTPEAVVVADVQEDEVEHLDSDEADHDVDDDEPEEVEPDPSVERDTSHTDDAISFGEPTSTPDDPGDVGVPPDEDTLEKRFEALREELRTTGTVEAPDPPPEGEARPEGDWGLPTH
jgi:cytoskeletal protein CcmA (bactofilin family)